MARMPALANESDQLMPAVFVTSTLAGTLAITQATAAIPIVNPALTDPVGFGLVESQAAGRPVDRLIDNPRQPAWEAAGNGEGVGARHHEDWMLVNVSNPGNAFHLRTAQAAAAALAVTLVEVGLPADIDAAFQTSAQ
jgi:hypothetical protein